jgi:hypothetical protein
MTPEADWVELTTTKTAFEAELLIGALRAAGVTAVLVGSAFTEQYAGVSDDLRVMVPSGQLEHARQALSERRAGPSPSR